MIKVFLNGASGQMGQLIAKNIALYEDMAIAGKKDKDVFEKGEQFDIVIDFSLPEGAKEAFQIAKQNKAAFLCGTTNLPQGFIDVLKQEKDKIGASIFETIGQFFYVFAVSSNSTLSIPIISVYSILSILFAHIFLKEKLTLRKSIAIILSFIGVIIVTANGNLLTTKDRSGCWIHKLVGVNGNSIPVRTGSVANTTSYPTYSIDAYSDSIFNGVNTHPKKNKSEYIVHTSPVSSTKTVPYGVVFGNGTAKESVNSYEMSGDLFVTYTASSVSEYGVDETGVYRTVTFTLTNTGAEDFTVSEVGIIGYVAETFGNSSYSNAIYYTNVLLERTLLENPITIPGNNGVGQVSYTIRMNFIPG